MTWTVGGAASSIPCQYAAAGPETSAFPPSQSQAARTRASSPGRWLATR
ncbi:hypothetical protein [Pseudonocardia lutea]